MSDQVSVPGGPGSSQIPMKELPITALQAMYHAVTGKTESITKQLTKAVKIELDDVRVLHTKIMQKKEHFVTPLSPTVTIVAKMHNSQSFTYSSWERFQSLEVASNELTSELNIKYEFLIKMPDITNPQRCIINVTIDSKFPILKDDMEENLEEDFYLLMPIDRIPTVAVRVEFVDFLLGKEFQQIVEDWFHALPEVHSPGWARKLSKMGRRKIAIFSNANYMMISVYMSVIPYCYPNAIKGFNEFSFFIASALVLFLLCRAATSQFSWFLTKHITFAIIPSLIMLTRGDQSFAATILERQQKAKAVLLGSLIFIFANLSVNLLASYIYGRWLS